MMDKYVLKKGDIIKFDGEFLSVYVGDEHALPTEENLESIQGYYENGYEMELVGLSLDRIKAEYVSREEQRQRDEKLIKLLTNFNLTYDISDTVENNIRKVFAEADKADVSRETEVDK